MSAAIQLAPDFAHATDVHALRFNFKPSGISATQLGRLQAANLKDGVGAVQVELPPAHAGGSSYWYQGQQIIARPTECVLLWDGTKQCYVLHRLATVTRLTHAKHPLPPLADLRSPPKRSRLIPPPARASTPLVPASSRAATPDAVEEFDFGSELSAEEGPPSAQVDLGLSRENGKDEALVTRMVKMVKDDPPSRAASPIAPAQSSPARPASTFPSSQPKPKLASLAAILNSPRPGSAPTSPLPGSSPFMSQQRAMKSLPQSPALNGAIKPTKRRKAINGTSPLSVRSFDSSSASALDDNDEDKSSGDEVVVKPAKVPSTPKVVAPPSKSYTRGAPSPRGTKNTARHAIGRRPAPSSRNASTGNVPQVVDIGSDVDEDLDFGDLAEELDGLSQKAAPRALDIGGSESD